MVGTRTRAVALTLAVFVAAVAVQLPIFDRAFIILDEGYLLAIADALNHGQVLYRDIHVEAPFPGAFYLLAGWFRLAGTSIRAERLLMVLVFAVFAAVLFRIAREVASRAWATAVLLLVLCYRVWAFPHWHMLSYSSLAVTFLTAAVVLLLVHLRRGTTETVLGAGALAGAGLLCKQDYGLGVSGAVGLYLLVAGPRPRLRAAAVFAAGVALVVLPALAALAAAGALPAMVEQTVVRPMIGVRGFPYARLPPLRPLFAQDAALRADIGSYFPAILLTLHWNAIAAGHAWRDTARWDGALKAIYHAPFAVWALAAVVWGLPALRGRGDARRLLVLAWAGGFLLAFNRPHDWVHLMMIYPPTFVVAAALLAATPRPARRALGALAVLVLGLLAVGSIRLGADLRAHMSTPFRSPRAGVFAEPEQVAVTEDVLGWIEASTLPGAPVPVYPLQPMIAFLAGRDVVAGFYIIWPLLQDPDRDAKIIAGLERRKVETIVYGVSHYAHLGSFRDNAPRLYEYLALHYEIERVFARQTFGLLLCGLRRRPNAEPAAAGLAADGRLVPTLWPFTPVSAERVGTPAEPAPASLTVRLPAGRPRLDFAYGINPERWLEAPSGPFTFALEADGTPIFQASVDPHRRLEDRRWIPASVDLSPWAGRTVTLTFSITAPVDAPQPEDLAGWARPRIVAQ